MVFITIFMDTLAATISTPALPYYARSFHVNNAAVGYLYAPWSKDPFPGFCIFLDIYDSTHICLIEIT